MVTTEQKRVWGFPFSLRSKPASAGPVPSSSPAVLMLLEHFIRGGVEQVVIDLCLVLRAAGWRVAIYANGETGGAAEQAEKSEITVYRGAGEGNGLATAIAKFAPDVCLA